MKISDYEPAAQKRKRYEDNSTEHDRESNHDDMSIYSPIIFPTFGSSVSKVSYGIGKRQDTGRAFEVKYHLNDTEILNRLICRVLSTSTYSTEEGIIHVLS